MNAPADDYDCLLTVSCPAGLEEDMIDLLREHPDWISGFTTLEAEGFGAGTKLHSSIEQVRGRARRRLFQVLLAAANREPLIAALRERLPSDEIAWWTTPVSGFGRFA